MSANHAHADTLSANEGVGRYTLVLALGTFAAGTGEFAIGAILPDIAGSLEVSVAQAGQLVTVFALAYAVFSPVLAALTGNWRPRTVLLSALGVYIAGIAATALAPSYGLALASQVLAAAGSGLFTPTAGATAAALAPADYRARAIAVVTTGLSISVALGVPLGTLFSVVTNWRGAMWFVVALSALAALSIAAMLPHVSTQPAVGLRQRIAPAGDRRVAAVLVTSVLTFTGIFILYTYISAAFERATGGEGASLAVLVFSWGAAGTIGALASGRFADRYGARMVVGVGALFMVVDFALLPFSSAYFTTAFIATAIYGVASWAITAPQQQRLIALTPASAPLVVSLNAAALFVGVSLSGLVGAAGLHVLGAERLGLLAAAFVAAGLCASEMAHRLARRKTPQDV